MYIAGLDQYYIPEDKKYPSWVQKLYDEQDQAQKRLDCLEKAVVPEQDWQTVEDEMTRLYDRLNEIRSQLGDYA
jgi:hypothetical protein